MNKINKITMKKLIPIVILFLFFSCQNTAQNKNSKNTTPTKKTQKTTNKKMSKAYFASGCFWCVEAIYERVNGVSEVINGYSGGHTKNPTYASSNTGRTGHAEAVEVIYDPEVVSFKTLVDVYFASQNPTQVNGQGPDHGSQYRSIIFYQNDNQKQIIDTKKAMLAKKLGQKIAAEVYPFEKFWIGEDYHQDYERLHPNHSYIKNISVPRLRRFQAKMPEVLKRNNH